VDYGSGELEDLDLFLPPDPQGAPIHMYIHGGFWRSRYKTDFSYIAEPLVDAGAIVAIVNYALCPNVDLDEIVRQMRAATGWLWRNAARFGGDPERIHIGGHSAGARLGAMVLTTDWQAFSLEVPSDVIKSATLISGVYEIEPVLHTSVQEEVRLTREMAIQNSPMFLSPTSKASIAVTVGGAESEEFRRQSEEFARRWRQYGLNVTHYELPRSDHFSVLTETANDANPLTETRLRLMGLI
jgi:arylformamidase